VFTFSAEKGGDDVFENENVRFNLSYKHGPRKLEIQMAGYRSVGFDCVARKATRVAV